MISERSQTVTLKKVRRYYFSWIESMWVLVCVVVCVWVCVCVWFAVKHLQCCRVSCTGTQSSCRSFWWR